MKRRIAIAGFTGFLGGALYRKVQSDPRWDALPLTRAELNNAELLAAALAETQVLLYFAGQSRSEDGEALYRENVSLVNVLLEALAKRGNDAPHLTVYFASTTHDAKTLPYHASKRDSAALLLNAAQTAPERLSSVILRLPNVFGPGGRPFFNSAVATFTWQAARGEEIRVNPDAGDLRLIHVDTVTHRVLELAADPATPTGTVTLDDEFILPVSECAELCRAFADGRVPESSSSRFEQLLYRQFQAAR